MASLAKWFPLMFVPMLATAQIAGQVVGATLSQPVPLAGAELRLGMSKESALAKFAGHDDIRLNQSGPEMMMVMARTANGWDLAGDLIFKSERLARIAVRNASDTATVQEFVKAMYSALAEGESAGFSDFWTGRNADAVNPIYAVHLVFKDREVVISSASGKIPAGRFDITSVETFYPRTVLEGKGSR